MKTVTQSIGIILLLFTASSCKKENIRQLPVTSQQEVSESKLSHYIGEPFGGGIIFYLDETGEHGLIVSRDEVLAEWWNGIYVETLAAGTELGAGAGNTRKIIRAQGSGNRYAALICAKYKVDDYADWYLPSIGELMELYAQKDLVGRFSQGPYWSSTENNKLNAWYQNFSLGNQFAGAKDGVGYVRAVRRF